MDINKILKEVKDVVKKEKPSFILNVSKSSERPYIFLYMNGSNHLDYEFKDGEWIIHLDLNYGHRKELGRIKGYNKVEYKQELWKPIPDPIKKVIEKLNKVFKESLKADSIKFITSKVKEKLLNRLVHSDKILDSKLGDDNLEVLLIQTEDDYGFFYQVQVKKDSRTIETYDFRNIELAQDKFNKIYKEF